jgi:dihydropyrimidinase
MSTKIELNRRRAIQLGTAASLGTLVGCNSDDQQSNPDSDSRIASSSVDGDQELLLKGGTVVLPAGNPLVDVRIVGQVVAEIGPALKPNSDDTKVLDCKGKHLLPGGIDPHVHLAKPWCDDFLSGSKAALAGGITCLGNMSLLPRGDDLRQAYERDCQKVKEKAIADFFFHYIFTDPAAIDGEVCQFLVEQKQPSIKLFALTKSFSESRNIADRLRLLRENGIVTLLHAEDFTILEEAKQNLVAAGRTSISAGYEASRPVEAEVAAVKDAIRWADESGCAIYLVHISSRAAIELVERAQNNGTRILIESRPMYLHLTNEIYARDDAELFVGMPPVRTQDDQEAAWNGIREGTVSTVASDHAPWTKQQKLDSGMTIENPLGGVNNLEVMLPMLMHEVTQNQRMTLQQFAEVTSRNAAQTFGLYPGKGEIKVGSDADVVIWDLEIRRTVSDKGYSNAGFSIYAGREITGWPVTTIRRGQIVWDNDDFTVERGGVVVRRNQNSGQTDD